MHHFLAPRRLLRAVENGEYVDLVRLDKVDDSIRAFYHFTYLLHLSFGYDTP